MFKGFTFIELTIAIAIVGILAIIAYPNFINFIEQAKNTKPQQILAYALTAQEARHMEFAEFADSWQQLDLGEDQTETHDYKALAPEPKKAAMIRAIPRSREIVGYVAGIEVVIKKQQQLYSKVICKAKKPGIKLIQEAEVEFRKRRVVCDNKFQKVS